MVRRLKIDKKSDEPLDACSKQMDDGAPRRKWDAGAGIWLENRPPHQYHEHCGRRGSAIVSLSKDCWWLREHYAARGSHEHLTDDHKLRARGSSGVLPL